MKFIVNRINFTNKLIDVSRAVPAKATIPILTGIKIEASNDGLTLIGSDSDISIESFLPSQDASYALKIEETGSIVVPSRLFNEIVRKLPTDIIQIETNDNFQLTVSSGEAVFSVAGQDGKAYPKLPDVDVEGKFELPTLLFKQLINQTLFAASNQESRPILTGLHLSLHDGYLTGVATDSHRLSRREIPVEFTQQEADFHAITIPKKTLIELERIVQSDQVLEMIALEQQVIFLAENLIVYSRLLEGQYPDTDRLIPDSHATEIKVNATTLLQAIDRASVISQQGKNNVVQLTVEEDSIELSVQGSALGAANEFIAYSEISGNPIKISFNPDYMKDALKSFHGIDIKVGFLSSVRPLVIYAAEPSAVEHNDLIQLLTPIRTH